MSVLIAGTSTFCRYVFEYLGKSTTALTRLSTTPTLPSTTTTQAVCNFVYSTIDDLTNETVTYSVNLCTTPLSTYSPLSSTTLAVSALNRSVQCIVRCVQSIYSEVFITSFLALLISVLVCLSPDNNMITIKAYLLTYCDNPQFICNAVLKLCNSSILVRI